MTTVLLDTHILLWWLQGGNRLSAKAKAILQDRGVRVLVSAASAWEIAIKRKAGKLDDATALVGRFESALEEESFAELAISVRHAVEAGLLKGTHRDPFDRMLIAQARLEGVAVVSTDKCFDAYGVPRLW